MPRQRVVDGQASFGGGLNLTADDSEVAENELRRADNARLTVFGAVKKRLGNRRTHAAAIGTANIVRGGFGWVKTDGTVEQLAISNGALHTGTYAIPMTWTAQAGGLDANVYPSFVAFYDSTQDVAYIADGGLLNKWNGTTLSVNIAGTPAVTQVEAYNLRLFGTGVAAQPARLYWSDLSNGDTLGNVASSGTGFADIRTFGQQPITALKSVGDSLFIFHPNAISVFTGYSQDDFNINAGTRGLSSEVGTTAPNAIVTVENVCYFVSNRGPYAASTSFGVKPIGTKVETVFASLDQTKFARLRAAHSPATREIFFYLPDAGIYCYNYRLDAWTGPWTGAFTTATTYSLWETVDASSIPIVLFGGQDGFVRRLDAASIFKDDVLSDGTGGDLFTFVARCRRLFFEDPFSEKAFRFGYVQTLLRGSASAGVSWATSTGSSSQTLYNSAYPIWGTFVWGVFTWGGSGVSSERFHLSDRGQYLDFTFSDDGLAESEWTGVQAEAFVLGRRY